MRKINYVEFCEIKRNNMTSPSISMKFLRGDFLNEVCILPEVLLFYRSMSYLCVSL